MESENIWKGRKAGKTNVADMRLLSKRTKAHGVKCYIKVTSQ